MAAGIMSTIQVGVSGLLQTVSKLGISTNNAAQPFSGLSGLIPSCSMDFTPET